MDPYKVLGLNRDASDEDAKQAFRTQAKTCHPDLHPNDPDAERRFKELNAAYDMISKGDRSDPIGGFRGNNFDFDNAFNYNPFTDMFREMRRRNNDINLAVTLTLEETFHGKEINLTINNRAIKAHLPRGVHNNARVMVAGGGNHPDPTQPPGDLYINVRVPPHAMFIRDHNNLIARVPVSAFDVLLNKTIQVDTIDGRSLNVTLSGSRMLRLSGQGMPDVHAPANRGDLLIELMIHYPERLSAEQVELITKAAEMSQ